MKNISFSDYSHFDADKNCISYRDGILEYYGSEIGQEPSNKVFKVYRSPATISNSALDINNLTVTDNHVDLIDIDDSKKLGSIKESVFIDFVDTELMSTIAIKNKVTLSDKGLTILDSKKECSLGYFADLIKSEREGIDFDQINIKPHHLAIVDAGRNGNKVRFIDSINKPKEEVMEESKKEDIKDIEEEKEVLVVEEEEIKDVEEEEKEDDKVEVKDSIAFADAVTAAVAIAIKDYSSVIIKAKDFLDADYKYEGIDTLQIMKDSIGSIYKDVELTDEEIKVAFKLLKKEVKYVGFADNVEQDKWEMIKTKEIK